MLRPHLSLFFLVVVLCAPPTLFPEAVHVMMAVYNTEEYLPHALDSIFAQTHPDFHLIVYNDGSKDRCAKILERYQRQYPEKMSLYGSRTNRGTAFARQVLMDRSLERSQEALSVWLDSDDAFKDRDFLRAFEEQMERSQADVCLFSFSLRLEDPEQKANLNGLLEERAANEALFASIRKGPNGALAPYKIPGLAQIFSMGGFKGYRNTVKWPKPLPCLFEDFVYMSVLWNAEKITALPPSYRPVEYLRRASSSTGQRTAQSFLDVLAQLRRFIECITLSGMK